MHDCLPPLFLLCTCVLYLHIVCLSCTFTLYCSVTCEHLHAMLFWPQTGTKLAYHCSRYGKWCWSALPYVNLHDALSNWCIELFSKLLPCRLTDYSEFRLFDTDSDADVLDCSFSYCRSHVWHRLATEIGEWWIFLNSILECSFL